MKHPVQSSPSIPEKVYFRIGEVSRLVGVEPHVLRYWESEFNEIRPHRAKSKQRLYRKKDVELLIRIRFLLHEKGYTLNGVRRLLTSLEQQDKRHAQFVEGQRHCEQKDILLKVIKTELKEIQKILSTPKTHK